MNTIHTLLLRFSLAFILSYSFSSCNFLISAITEAMVTAASSSDSEPNNTPDENNTSYDYYLLHEFDKNDVCQIKELKDTDIKVKVENGSLKIENSSKKLDYDFSFDCNNFYRQLPVNFSIHSEFGFIRGQLENQILNYNFKNESEEYTVMINANGSIQITENEFETGNTRTITNAHLNLEKIKNKIRFQIEASFITLIVNGEKIKNFQFSGFEWQDYSVSVAKGTSVIFDSYKITNDSYIN